MQLGMVFNIQKYSVHDGPGIRTVVFLKGCPLRCGWCSNPESWSLHPTLSINSKVCISCKECLNVCPRQAMSWSEAGPKFNQEKCDYCGKCEEICVSGAMKIFGRLMTAEQIIEDVLKDEKFFVRSGGGLTISGGEPLLQHQFTKELLIRAQQMGLNTNVETTAFASREIIKDVLSLSDLIFCDLKHIDSATHRYFTGQPNELILDNIKFMSENSYPIVVRIPLIPGFNADEESLRNIAIFLSGLKGVKRIGLLPYHNYGKGKFDLLGEQNKWDCEKLNDEDIEKATEIICSAGYPVVVGE